jgi:hypothetical protein
MDLYSLLSEIELDVKELKLLINSSSSAADGSSKSLLLRNINQTKEHLDSLSALLTAEPDVQSVDIDEHHGLLPPKVDSAEVAEPEVKMPEGAADPTAEPEHDEEPENEATTVSDAIIADVMPKGELRSVLSLNDSFLYARELFGGSMESLNNFLDRASQLRSSDDASRLLKASVDDGADENVIEEMLLLLKRYFE